MYWFPIWNRKNRSFIHRYESFDPLCTDYQTKVELEIFLHGRYNIKYILSSSYFAILYSSWSSTCSISFNKILIIKVWKKYSKNMALVNCQFLCASQYESCPKCISVYCCLFRLDQAESCMKWIVGTVGYLLKYNSHNNVFLSLHPIDKPWD